MNILKNNKRNIETELEKIKSVRLIELKQLSVSRIKKTLKKVRYLLKYGMPMKKIIRYSILFALKSPIERLILSFNGNRYKKHFKSFCGNDKCCVAVNLGNAGIGDGIVALRAVRDILEKAGDKAGDGVGSGNGGIVVDIFFSSPAAIEFIALPQKYVRSVMDLYDYKILSGHYDIIFRLNTFFISEHINKKSINKVSANLPILIDLMRNIKDSRKPLEKYIRLRPFSEGVLSDAIVKTGYRRETYLSYSAGIAEQEENYEKQEDKKYKKISKNPVLDSGLKLNIDFDKKAIYKFNLEGKKFITIHDGWDENTKIKNKTSTKSYPFNSWIKLIQELKLRLPEYCMVQIGGTGNGSDIEGVDYNLRGQTTLKEAAGVLAASSLHIDTDSGLVHIAASLGIKCAVLFGPTNIDYCSYGQNLNIGPKKCGNCWWSTDDWMEKCPRGLEAPECMASIEPAETAERIKIFLKDGVK